MGQFCRARDTVNYGKPHRYEQGGCVFCGAREDGQPWVEIRESEPAPVSTRAYAVRYSGRGDQDDRPVEERWLKNFDVLHRGLAGVKGNVIEFSNPGQMPQVVEQMEQFLRKRNYLSPNEELILHAA